MKIEGVSSAKYVGIIFGELLNWHEHVDSVCKSLLKYFVIFNHVKCVIPRAIARQLYFAFVYSRAGADSRGRTWRPPPRP